MSADSVYIFNSHVQSKAGFFAEVKTLSTYRSLAATLTLAFLLFNIGMPIIIDTCPMPKPSGSMICYMCAEQSRGDSRLPVLKGKSCCSPLLAAERNTNEFLQAEKALAALGGTDCVSAFSVASPLCLPAVHAVPGAFSPSSPPLAATDLPILHSCLLI